MKKTIIAALVASAFLASSNVLAGEFDFNGYGFHNQNTVNSTADSEKIKSRMQQMRQNFTTKRDDVKTKIGRVVSQNANNDTASTNRFHSDSVASITPNTGTTKYSRAITTSQISCNPASEGVIARNTSGDIFACHNGSWKSSTAALQGQINALSAKVNNSGNVRISRYTSCNVYNCFSRYGSYNYRCGKYVDYGDESELRMFKYWRECKIYLRLTKSNGTYQDLFLRMEGNYPYAH